MANTGQADTIRRLPIVLDQHNDINAFLKFPTILKIVFFVRANLSKLI